MGHSAQSAHGHAQQTLEEFTRMHPIWYSKKNLVAYGNSGEYELFGTKQQLINTIQFIQYTDIDFIHPWKKKKKKSHSDQKNIYSKEGMINML